MAKVTDLKYVEAIDTGVMDLQALRDNFDNITEVVNEHASEMVALASKHTHTISFAIEAVGETTILTGGKHLGGTITNAYVQMGDSIPKESILEILGISNSIKVSGTEKAGKVRIFNVLRKHLLLYENVVVRSSSDRRAIINITIEGRTESVE